MVREFRMRSEAIQKLKKFTPIQATVIRERLILYFNSRKELNDHKSEVTQHIKMTVRELLLDIVFSEFTDYEDKSPECDDDRPYDYYFSLKDDTLGNFLSRRQNTISDKNLLNIANFLLGNGYLDSNELLVFRALDGMDFTSSLKAPKKIKALIAPKPGEYISSVDEGKFLKILSFRFSKRPKANQTLVVQKDFRVSKPSSCLNNNSAAIRLFRKHNLIETSIASGVCIFPMEGPINLLLFDENRQVKLHKIVVKNSGKGFNEISPRNLEFALLNQADSRLVRLYLASNKTFKNEQDPTSGGVIYSREPNFRPKINDLDANSPGKIHSHRHYETNLPDKPQEHDYVDYVESIPAFLRKHSRHAPKKWDEQFISAAEQLDFEKLVDALMHGANIWTASKTSGNTVLHWAALHSSREMYDLATGRLYLSSREYFQDKAILEDSNILKSSKEEYSFSSVLGPPILKRNSDNLLPSSCVPKVTFAPKNPLDEFRMNLFLDILQTEYRFSCASGGEFLGLLSDNPSSTIFPNII